MSEKTSHYTKDELKHIRETLSQDEISSLGKKVETEITEYIGAGWNAFVLLRDGYWVDVEVEYGGKVERFGLYPCVCCAKKEAPSGIRGFLQRVGYVYGEPEVRDVFRIRKPTEHDVTPTTTEVEGV